MCGYCDIVNIDKEVDPPTPFNENDFNQFSNDVWIGAVTPAQLPQSIYLKTAKYLKDGIDLAPVVDEVLTADLLNNIYVFSGAKTYQQTRALTALLAVDEYKSNFYAFKRAAEPIFGTYNQDYLQAEYQTAKASARMASDWKRIEIDKDVLPLLKYQTVGDGRVRPTHQQLDNIVRPVNDPFWKQYYPPNGWRCRCTVAQLAEDEEPLTDMSNFTPPDDVPPLFRMNAGIDGYVFKTKGKDKHPYFDIAKEDKANAKVNWNLPIPQAPRPAPIIEVPKVFTPATSIKEAEERLKLLTISQNAIDLQNTELEIANSVIKKLEEYSVKNIKFYDISLSNDFAAFALEDSTDLQICKQATIEGHKKALEIQIKKNKWYNSGARLAFVEEDSINKYVQYSVEHEINHLQHYKVIDASKGAFGDEMQKQAKKWNNEWNNYITKIHRNENEWHPSDYVKRFVYEKDYTKEWLAESLLYFNYNKSIINDEKIIKLLSEFTNIINKITKY